MQRREFSAATLGVMSASVLPALSAYAQDETFKEGSDYVALEKSAPTESPAGQTEVVEFFWYSCSHCNAFEPQLEAWVKKLPKHVSFKRVPVSFRPVFEPQQRLYYTLEALGKLGELHAKVFAAIHKQGQALNTPELIADWAEKQGLNKLKFSELYNSFAVSTKVRKATQLQEAYLVDGVPALGIAGRFFTSGGLARSMERALRVTDYLIAQARTKA